MSGTGTPPRGARAGKNSARHPTKSKPDSNAKIRFSHPSLSDTEERYIRAALDEGYLHGGGGFTDRCQKHLREIIGGEALLTTSGTAGLEMAAILCGLEPGDEVILPSYTFSSTANAVVLRGAVPVFVDIRADTLNIDERRIEEVVTSRTRAIFPVHYAGICAEMDAIGEIAGRYGLMVVEDAAQALGSSYRGRPAGSIGDLACFSFHATKNIVSGEGGALLVNRPELAERAQIVWEKGTNRREFVEGRVDKYTWVDLGSSFLPSEVTAALLLAQLERAAEINADRLATWQFYHAAFEVAEKRGLVVRPTVPPHCTHNGHIYYLLLPDREARDALSRALAVDGINAPFHYVPLHSSPAGRRFGRTHGELKTTDAAGSRLIRLPLYVDIGERAEVVVERVLAHLDRLG